MPISVVIPAHDEEAVIGRCLDAILEGASPGELDVAVVCNGCRDGTADVVRRYAGRVKLVETSVGAKWNALNLGDDAVTGFPRFYVDADVFLPLASLRAIAARLGPASPAGSPTMRMDFSRSSWAVRAYYRVWTMTPYVREGMIGVGVYALTEEGRARFGRFPDLIADDGYVRALFAPHERVSVEEAGVTVLAPATIANVVRTKTRSRLGDVQLAARFPDLVARQQRARQGYLASLAPALARPWLWPHAAVYVGVNLVARWRAKGQAARGATNVWERDGSTRLPAPSQRAGSTPKR